MAVLRRNVNAPRPPHEYDPRKAAFDARKIAQSNGLELMPLDVKGLAQTLGLRMSSTPMPENISGFISREGDAWVLGVNSLHHPNRQRFTIAHEIGHFLLHRDHGSFHDGLLFRRDDELNQQEREANQFAALVLMPEADFKTVVRRMPVEDAAKLFGVSAQAAKYRYATVSAQFGID